MILFHICVPIFGVKEEASSVNDHSSGFSLGCYTWGGQVQGDKALMGGTHEGGHRPYGGGPNFDRL